MNCSRPGLPVHHQLPEFTQTHVHRVSDAISASPKYFSLYLLGTGHSSAKCQCRKPHRCKSHRYCSEEGHWSWCVQMTVAFPLDNSHVWLLQNICSAYELCIHFTQIYMYFVKTKFFKVLITGGHCLPLKVLLWMTCLPSYFHLSTLNTICCLINHKDLVDTTHSPNHCTTREFPHVFTLLDFYVCLWLIEMECGLTLARWRRGQCVCVYHQEL